ncbi:hypothetical protein FB451DRAFT_1241807, partial [Mycena latifolia]
MISHFFIYAFLAASFGAWGRAALVSVTIEDTSPLMQYNCTIPGQRCDANATNPNPCEFGSEADNHTFTYLPESCQITIPFVGTAVYAFVGCPDDVCQFEVDDTGVHDSIPFQGIITEAETG